MTVRNADYMYNNGGVWDQLLFSTSESQIKSGFTQSVSGEANYKVLPGGLKIQYGRTLVYTASNKNLDYALTLPIAFSGAKDRIYIAGSLMNSSDPWQAAQVNTHVVINSLSQLRFVNVSGLNPSAQYELRWVAIGY